RRLGPRSLDQDSAWLASADAQAQARLDVFRRARSIDRREGPGMRARADYRRLIVNQRHGLYAGPPRRLRPLGGLRPYRMVLRARAAIFPASGILGGRHQLLPRWRGTA